MSERPATAEEVEAVMALEALRDGCRERGLDVKGDGDWMQMVKTVLVIVDNNRRLRDRLEELGREIRDRTT